MRVKVTKPNVFERGRRCHVGQVLTIEGDQVPANYAGSVVPIIKAAAPSIRHAPEGTTTDADNQRRQWLMDQIQELTGKRPSHNTKIQNLESRFEQAKLDQE